MAIGSLIVKEWRGASRNPRLFLVRVVTATVIALSLGLSVGATTEAWRGATLSLGELSTMGKVAFGSFVITQGAAMLLLAPLWTAGIVAEEKARGTLGLLLTTRLSPAEIILGKLASRMLVLLTTMLAGLPILAIISLFGGIEPERVTGLYLETLTAGWTAASIAALVSVHARSMPTAVIASLLAVWAWLFVPIWLSDYVRSQTPTLAWSLIQACLDELARSSPQSTFSEPTFWRSTARRPLGFQDILFGLIVRQIILGSLLILLAALRLKPLYLQQADRRTSTRFSVPLRWLGLREAGYLPPCGDNALRWKERHSPESRRLARLLILCAVVLVTYSTAVELRYDSTGAYHAFDELFRHGLDPGPWGSHGAFRNGIKYRLCEKASILYVAALAASSIMAASSVAGERSRGTWLSLISTPLEPTEILRAKMQGAIWAVRAPLAMIVFLYVAALISTMMHPVGFVLGLAAIASYQWFGVALGLYVSVRVSDVWRAIAYTVTTLLAINLIPAALLSPYLGSFTMAGMLTTCTPLIVEEISVSPMRFHQFVSAIHHDPKALIVLSIMLTATAAHALAAFLLVRASRQRIAAHLMTMATAIRLQQPKSGSKALQILDKCPTLIVRELWTNDPLERMGLRCFACT
ncbi:ABC transporter permease [Singulisphaera sp. PoT]|uniref:ABC transporter permease n=1 Tax=Singulisphaera sp. PoT TaxID=3411797 RepID=UPI003BF48FC5